MTSPSLHLLDGALGFRFDVAAHHMADDPMRPAHLFDGERLVGSGFDPIERELDQLVHVSRFSLLHRV